MTAPTYDESYFKSANYAGYLERGDRYRRTACEIIELLRKLGRIERDSRIVDYGCAVGLLMSGFIGEGYQNIVGVDASAWAREQATMRLLAVFAPSCWPRVADVLVALDVFEHMTDAEVTAAFSCKPSVFIARIPVSTDGKIFHLAVSRADPTHINCKTKEQWEERFRALGYVTTRLHLFSIYNTPGVACLLGLRI